MSILYGFYQADSGTIRIDGKELKIPDSQAAIASGIGMVHQHFMLVQNFSVLENVILGAEGGAILNQGIAQAKEELRRLEEEYALDVDIKALIEDLPVGLQQRVEILKALFRGADILILDEPTGVLTPAEADHLFRIFEQLRDEGKTIILITHKLREIMAITDDVSVMRRGQMVATRKTSKTSVEELAELMVGRSVLLRVDKEEATPGEEKLVVENLTVKDDRGVVMVDDVSFSVRAGEIVGIAGVAGNGQSELLEAISGILKAQSGRILLDGEPLAWTVMRTLPCFVNAAWPMFPKIAITSDWYCLLPKRKTQFWVIKVMRIILLAFSYRWTRLKRMQEKKSSNTIFARPTRI